MFLFKKIVAQIINPIPLTLELIVIGLLLVIFTSRRKIGEALILAGVVMLALCSYTPTADFLIKPLKERYSPYRPENSATDNQMPKTIVVLGAGYNSNPSLPITSRIGYDSLVRLIEGIRLCRMIPEGKLLLSGGTESGSISSAQDMAELARDIGVGEENIIIESISRDTKDQAQIISSILGNTPFVLVTSASHMTRSMALFRKIGMNPIPAPTISIEQKLLYLTPNPFIPSSVNLQKSEIAFHEYLGMAWAKLRNQI